MNRLMVILLAALTVIAVGAVALYLLMRGSSRPLSPQEASAELENLLRNKVARDDALRNGVLLVDAPALGIDGAWATGVAYERNGTEMTAETPFLSASIGKLFTAATVLALAEEGVLSLDDSMTVWLPAEVYEGIPVKGGDAALSDVTVRMLLSHRSGFPDYFEGKTKDRAPNIIELLRTEPERAWTPDTLLAYTKEHFKPIGAPGERFEYADTNYDLLGMIVEQATGQPFHEVVADYVLEPLALQHTWYHARTDPSRIGPPQPETASYADVWMDDANLANVPSLSLDWAGGGLATTAADLRIFLRSLVDGRPVALDAFQQEWTENSLARGIDYAYGLWRIRPAGLFFLMRGYPDVVGVSGITGTYLYYVPEYDAVITGAFNQTGYQQAHVRFLLQVLALLGRVQS